MRYIMATALSLVLAAGAAAQDGQAPDDRPKISVSGEAVVKVLPDKIVVTLGIETWDLDIQVARTKNNDILRAARHEIQSVGVSPSDVQTDHLSIEPRYENGYRKETFIGYFVRNTLVVTLGEAERVEELVTRVLAVGVNYVHGVDFQTTEFKTHRERARELALRAAKEKADQMAAVLGHTVGDPIQINEHGSPWWHMSSWSWWGRGRGQPMTQNVVQNVPGGGETPSEGIALGKISIRANVNVTFALR